MFDKGLVGHNIKRNQSRLPRIGPYNVCKTSLLFFEDKRKTLYDRISSFTYFHGDALGWQ